MNNSRLPPDAPPPTHLRVLQGGAQALNAVPAVTPTHDAATPPVIYERTQRNSWPNDSTYLKAVEAENPRTLVGQVSKAARPPVVAIGPHLETLFAAHQRARQEHHSPGRKELAQHWWASVDAWQPEKAAGTAHLALEDWLFTLALHRQLVQLMTSAKVKSIKALSAKLISLHDRHLATLPAFSDNQAAQQRLLAAHDARVALAGAPAADVLWVYSTLKANIFDALFTAYGREWPSEDKRRIDAIVDELSKDLGDAPKVRFSAKQLLLQPAYYAHLGRALPTVVQRSPG